MYIGACATIKCRNEFFGRASLLKDGVNRPAVTACSTRILYVYRVPTYCRYVYYTAYNIYYVIVLLCSCTGRGVKRRAVAATLSIISFTVRFRITKRNNATQNATQ